MPRMKFLEIHQFIEDISNITNKNNLIKHSVQWTLDRILCAWNWPFLNEETYITTVAPYSTGTLTATKDSKTITGSGTTWTSSMVNRKIRINSETAYYRIAEFVSVTELTLETVYQNTTAAGLSYSIFKDEYRLAPNLDKLKVMRQIEEGIALTGVSQAAFDIYEPAPSSQGNPKMSILVGTKLDIYSTGTISGIVNTSVLTGAGTSWTNVEGLGKGSRITIGSDVFTVKTVDSNTQITIYEKLSTTFAVLTTYSVSLDNYIIQFFDIPDSITNIYYRFQRISYPLINDYDIPDLPEQYHHLLILGALSYLWMTKDKNQADVMDRRFEKELFIMKQKVGCVSESITYKRTSLLSPEIKRGPRPPDGYGIPLGR